MTTSEKQHFKKWRGGQLLSNAPAPVVGCWLHLCLNDRTKEMTSDSQNTQIQTVVLPYFLSVSTHLVTIVGPGAEGEGALLPVEGEVGDINHTRAFGDGWRVPHDLSIVSQLHISVGRTCRLLVGSTHTNNQAGWGLVSSLYFAPFVTDLLYRTMSGFQTRSLGMLIISRSL